jgi:hypothetical protein
MNQNELEAKRRNAISFQVAQRIVAALNDVNPEDVDSTLKLATEILRSDDQRNLAVITCQQERRSGVRSVPRS